MTFLEKNYFCTMTKKCLFLWILFFWLGIVVMIFVPEQSLAFLPKMICLGIWDSIILLLAFKVSEKPVEDDFELTTPEEKPATIDEVKDYIAESTGMHSAVQDAAAETQEEASAEPEEQIHELPTKQWEDFMKTTLRNRPFPEVVSTLAELLPEMFEGSSGILYMYNGKQSEMARITSYGDTVLGKEIISPSECASFNRGEIEVTDFENLGLSGGCTHLDHQKQGVAFCVPIEGLEEHFGVLSVYAKELNEEKRKLWKTQLKIIATIFGLYVADVNMKVRFDEHNIRDTLTGLFNRRYMEESLQREIAASKRHRTPIGMVMIYPDQIADIRAQYGKKTAEQLLWEIGQRLPKYIRTEDIPCRFEEDTFVILLPGADFTITQERAERIRREIEGLEIAYGDVILKSTLSLGVSVMPQFAKNKDELINTTIMALQTAAQSGQNMVVTVADIRR